MSVLCGVSWLPTWCSIVTYMGAILSQKVRVGDIHNFKARRQKNWRILPLFSNVSLIMQIFIILGVKKRGWVAPRPSANCAHGYLCWKSCVCLCHLLFSMYFLFPDKFVSALGRPVSDDDRKFLFEELSLLKRFTGMAMSCCKSFRFLEIVYLRFTLVLIQSKIVITN